MKNFLTSICFAALALGLSAANAQEAEIGVLQGQDFENGYIDFPELSIEGQNNGEIRFTHSVAAPPGNVFYVGYRNENPLSGGTSNTVIILSVNTLGQINTDFGENGVSEILLEGARQFEPSGVLIANSGNLIIGAQVRYPYDSDGLEPRGFAAGGVIAVDKTSGALVSDFGVDGIALITSEQFYDEGRDENNTNNSWRLVGEGPGGKLYLASTVSVSWLARMNFNGAMDTSFFTDGVFRFPTYGDLGDPWVLGVSHDSDDFLASEPVIGLQAGNGNGESFYSFIKLDPASETYEHNGPGSQQPPSPDSYRDTDFGVDGEKRVNFNDFATTPEDEYLDRARSTAPLDAGGYLFWTASASAQGNPAPVYRVDGDGSIDEAFGTDPLPNTANTTGTKGVLYLDEETVPGLLGSYSDPAVFINDTSPGGDVNFYVLYDKYNGHYRRFAKFTNGAPDSSLGSGGALDFTGVDEFNACSDNSSKVGDTLVVNYYAGTFNFLTLRVDERDEETYNTLASTYGQISLGEVFYNGDGPDPTQLCGPSSNPGGGGGGEPPSFEDVPGLALAVNTAGGSVTVSVTGIDARMENGDVTIFPATDGPVSSCTYDADAMAPVPAEAGCRDLAFSENAAFFCADSSTFPPEFNCSEIPSDGQAELVLTQLAYREYDGTGQEETPPGCDSCPPYTRYNYEIVYEPFDPTVTYRVRSMFNAYDESTSTELRQEAEPFDFQVSGGDSSGGGSEEPSAPDADSDGVPDAEDDFPSDPNETTDTDEDGVGDNADAFPNDPEESTDADSDGVGANTDPDDNDASFTGSPVVIAASDYSAVQVAVGEGQVLINGSPVTATTTSVAVAVGVVPNGGPSPEQVVELQNYADQVKAKVDAALETGASSPITVVDTDAGASIRGLIADEDVPIENIAIIEVADPRLLVLVTGKNANGELATITDGGTIEFGLGGRIVVLASGMEPGDQGEIVLFSEPDQLAVFDVDAGGVVQAEAVIPADTPVGEHTLVVAAPNLFSSLGFRVVANTRAQSDATPVPSLPLGFVWLLGLVVAYAGSRKLVLR